MTDHFYLIWVSASKIKLKVENALYYCTKKTKLEISSYWALFTQKIAFQSFLICSSLYFTFAATKGEVSYLGGVVVI